MEYELTIRKYEKNPSYKPQEEPGYDYRKPHERNREYELECLSVRVSKEQFEAIRKATLEVF